MGEVASIKHAESTLPLHQVERLHQQQ